MKSNSIWGWGSCCLHEFSLSNNYLFSLRTTTCDTLIVPSEIIYFEKRKVQVLMEHLNKNLNILKHNNLLVSLVEHGMPLLVSMLNLLYLKNKFQRHQMKYNVNHLKESRTSQFWHPLRPNARTMSSSSLLWPQLPEPWRKYTTLKATDSLGTIKASQAVVLNEDM